MKSTIPNNQHVKDFLSCYAKLKSPGYAVLVTGPWGCGKTFLVNQFSSELTDENLLKISLNGLSSISEINNALISAIFPTLTSTPAKFITRIITKIINPSLTISKTPDGNTETNLSIKPDENILDLLKDTKDRLLIFDDIERCTVPIPTLLGYINQFVEHDDCRVILVADESEIIKKEPKEILETHPQHYLRIKEKLIGKTFKIEPEIKLALKKFSEQLNDEPTKVVVQENESLIIQLFNNSTYSNLRILRYALIEFTRVYEVVDDECKKNKGLITHFLALFLIYEFEIKSGSIEINELVHIKTRVRLKFKTSSDGDSNASLRFEKINQKYIKAGVNLIITLLPESVWIDLFTNGLIPSKDINESLHNSEYFKSENQPDWVKLWNIRNLSDRNFENLLNKILKKWKGMSFNESGIVLHVTGILLFLASNGLYQENEEQILTYSMQHIDKLKLNGQLLSDTDKIKYSFSSNSYNGLEFYSKDNKYFLQLKKYVSEQKEMALIDNYKKEAKNLLYMMKSDTDKFLQSLIHSNHQDNKFFNIPILKEIDPSQFVNTLMNLSPEQMQTVGYVFQSRYQNEDFNKILVVELNWLMQVKKLLQLEKDKRIGKLSGYFCSLLIDSDLPRALEYLKKQSGQS